MVREELFCHRFWEDAQHLAFLSGNPNTPGVSVVITKVHYPSYAFDLPDNVLEALMVATKRVGKLLDSKLKDVGRTGLIMEGFGVDHVHAKLFPMHGTAEMEWRPIMSDQQVFFETYPGYLTSQESRRPPEKELAALAAHLRGE